MTGRIRRSFLLRQVFHKAHAVVAEDDFALLLGGVQINVGFYAEVAGVFLVQEDLADVPLSLIHISTMSRSTLLGKSS